LSEGIHQAIEAKEKVVIQRESKTLATVSLQNYFRMYEKLAGMTGTAVTEAEEFNKIYKLEVVVIPTNNPITRIDHADSVYKTTRAKMTAVVNEIAQVHKKGQPVLVGTTSIQKNEVLSEMLKRRGIKHELLNAKNHQKEAEIIALAGKKGAVTVATNMAGRGVDIILGGDTPKEDGTTDKQYKELQEKWKKEHDEVLRLGGLYVIGTERHESRRIDNQLRGRSGRQGDPGTSRFFVALDDEIMRLFGGDRIAGIMTRFNMPEDVPLTHSLVSKAIENAQVKVEGFNFDIRKHLVRYDDVLNKQREIIYSLRRKVLESSSTTESILRDEVLERVQNTIRQVVTAITSVAGFDEKESQNGKIVQEFVTIIPFDEGSQKQLVIQLEQRHGVEEKIEFLTTISEDLYVQREKQFGEKAMRDIERHVMLSVIDTLWMNHLDVIDNLRQGIGLRGYAQKDPLVEYKNEAYRMFEQLVTGIDDEIAHRIYRMPIQVPSHTHDPETGQIIMNMPVSEISEDTKKVQSGRGAKMQRKERVDGRVDVKKLGRLAEQDDRPANLGRNDPCPCGSGLKYKKCGLINASQHKA
jgi:preprotein translocase subunit SecA